MIRTHLLEIVEVTLLSFLLSGTLWNTAVGAGAIAPPDAAVAVALTTLLGAAFFTADNVRGPRTIDPR
ncbi:hypothetical protein ACFQPA_14865 [Halomarina halobia]|uniref:Uncharacterized protein n=1 Tax=Halomarina halobia TaxID=3033386 RepID=A0ABD6A8A2_9EURY|nr:hypothetical protein [Halomarina sp. PSR21]